SRVTSSSPPISSSSETRSLPPNPHPSEQPILSRLASEMNRSFPPSTPYLKTL
ncbi:hypothetical protein CDAR_116231, partial [Caerostris darwini]